MISSGKTSRQTVLVQSSSFKKKQNKNTKASLKFTKLHLNKPQDFWMSPKCSCSSELNQDQHVSRNTSSSFVKHGGGGVMIRGGCAATESTINLSARTWARRSWAPKCESTSVTATAWWIWSTPTGQNWWKMNVWERPLNDLVNVQRWTLLNVRKPERTEATSWRKMGQNSCERLNVTK